MKISIEFDDVIDARHALDTHLYRGVLMEMREFFLEGLKHGKGQFSLKQIKAVLKEEAIGQTTDLVAARSQTMLLECALSHLEYLCETSQITLYDA
tara:strand:- start:1814 stop:2101 length:288 start_codon:yes stop_codon:yes gene_type:complete